jgi:hypothetical protein
MDQNYSLAEQVEVGGMPRDRLHLTDVYRLYTAHFGRWFAITAPTSILATLVVFLADKRIHAIYSSIPALEVPHRPDVLGETFVLRFGSFFIAWFLGCFALAAIATVLNGLDADPGEVWRRDSFQLAREHFVSLLRAAVITFGVFLLGLAVMVAVGIASLRLFGRARFPGLIMAVTAIGYTLVASVVSRLGMAIPLVLAGEAGVGTALKKSIRLSDGYEAVLCWLVVESMAGSYAAWYAVHYGLVIVLPPYLRSMEWYGWFEYAATILASAAVQPPMFIGFSLLARNNIPVSSILPRPQCPAHID